MGKVVRIETRKQYIKADHANKLKDLDPKKMAQIREAFKHMIKHMNQFLMLTDDEVYLRK